MKKFTFIALATMLIGVFTSQAQFHESFEDAGVTPSGWSIINGGGTKTWEFIEDDYNQGNTGIGYAELSGVGETQDHDDYLVTPAITVTAGLNDQFRFYASRSNNYAYDKFDLVLSTTGNAAADFTETLLGEEQPTVYEWEEHVFDLSAYDGQTVYIAFYSKTPVGGPGNQGSIKIDDVYSEGMPNCETPTDISVTNQTTTSADLSWTENGTATEWEVTYGISPFSPATEGTTETVTGGIAELTLTGLTPDEDYDVYVRAVCDPTLTSNNSTVKSFQTGYCSFSATNGGGRFINLFQTQNAIQDINNATATAPGNGYTDATNISLETTASQTFDFTVGLEGAPAFTYGVNIWVDWNKDMIFDASEKVWSSNGLSAYMSGSITIPAGVANDDYRMRIVADTDTGNPDACGIIYSGEAEDYTLTVVDAPTCPAVSNLTVVSTGANTAELTWDAGGTETEWEIVYGLQGFDPATEGTTEIDDDGVLGITLTELTPNTAYDFYVTAVCDENDESLQFGIGHFTTDCESVGIPYTMDFEVANPPSLAECTSEENLGFGNTWETESVFANGFTNFAATYNTDQNYSADAWFYTQGVELQAGVNYKIRYTYGNDDESTVEKMNVAFGTSPVVAEMVNSIVSYTNITGGQAINDSIEFSVPTDGVFFFGFNALSDADQGKIYLDDIKIDFGEIPACEAAANVEVTDIQNEQVSVYWTTTPVAVNGYVINVFEEGADPLTATPVATEAVAEGVTTVTITGLTGKTTYEVYVTSNCDAGETVTSDAVTFTSNNLSVSDNELTQVTYSPNPVSSMLNITAESTIETVIVYNLTGKAVMEVNTNDASVDIDMSSLSNGTYFVKAKVADSVSTFKIVKQ